MLKGYKRRHSLPGRLWQAVKRAVTEKELYGLAWGDPQRVEPLGFIRDRYVLPYVHTGQDAVEIGPGGGRWTRSLLVSTATRPRSWPSSTRPNFWQPFGLSSRWLRSASDHTTGFQARARAPRPKPEA